MLRCTLVINGDRWKINVDMGGGGDGWLHHWVTPHRLRRDGGGGGGGQAREIPHPAIEMSSFFRVVLKFAASVYCSFLRFLEMMS